MNEVTWYRRAHIEVTVRFPNGKAVCQNCRQFLRYDKDAGVRYCFLTGESIGSPETQLGGMCPLIWEE